jgi:hypothetical protein
LRIPHLFPEFRSGAGAFPVHTEISLSNKARASLGELMPESADELFVSFRYWPD